SYVLVTDQYISYAYVLVSDQYISITFIRSFHILGHAFYRIELIGFPLISNQLRSKAIVGNGHLAMMTSIKSIFDVCWLWLAGSEEQQHPQSHCHIGFPWHRSIG